MSEPDEKYRYAVDVLEHVGYRWIDGAWELPHADELAPDRKLSLIDIADLLYRGVAGSDELWETETSYGSRHISRGPSRPRPTLTVVSRDNE
jgi:hypothetical protein